MTSCLHANEIIDHHEGTIICVECGIVKDVYYDYNNVKNNEDPFIQKDLLCQIGNFVDQLHLPREFIQIINNNISTSKNNKGKIVNQQKNKMSVKKLASEIYNTVNKHNSTLLLKDILNFSHLSPPEIKSQDILLVDLSEILEKYTKKFNIDYKTYTVIKDKVDKFKNTGFQPLTIIGGIIYLHFSSIRKKVSMRKISEILGISSISIQRFLKYNHEISSRN